MENIWYPLTGKMEKQLRKKYLSDAIIYFLLFFVFFLVFPFAMAYSQRGNIHKMIEAGTFDLSFFSALETKNKIAIPILFLVWFVIFFMSIQEWRTIRNLFSGTLEFSKGIICMITKNELSHRIENIVDIQLMNFQTIKMTDHCPNDYLHVGDQVYLVRKRRKRKNDKYYILETESFPEIRSERFEEHCRRDLCKLIGYLKSAYICCFISSFSFLVFAQFLSYGTIEEHLLSIATTLIPWSIGFFIYLFCLTLQYFQHRQLYGR